MTTTIQGPDGALIDFPDETSEAEMNAAMAQAYPAPSPQAGGVMGALKGASRALEANLPFVDRAVAAAKGGDYGANLATEQAKNAQFAQDNPWTNALGGLVASAPLATVGGPSFGLGGLAGRVASTATPFAIAGGVQGISNAPDLTDLSQGGVAKGALTGSAEGGALGAAVPIAGAAVGRAISPLAAALRGPGAADVAKLGGDVSAAYQNVKDLGAAYSPQQTQAMVDKIASDANRELINPKLNAKASATIESLQQMAADKAETGQSLTLPELDTWRQFVNDNLLSGMPEGKQARFGQIIKGNIDDFIKQAEPHAMEPNPAPPAPNYNPPVGPDTDYVPPGLHAGMNSDNRGLVVAQRMPDGTVQYGRPGNIHSQLYAMQDEIPQDSDLGFAKPGGPFMSRDEAAKYQAPVAPPRGSGPVPVPLLDAMRRYGLQDEGGDLASMGFANKTGVAPKGVSKIIDKAGGVPMDEGLRVAKELGYMEPDDTVSDFINKLGNHPTYSRADQEEVARRAARSEFDLGPPQGELSNPANYEQPPSQVGPSQLVVARRIPGDGVQYGEPGQIHFDLLRNADDLPGKAGTMEKYNKLNMEDLGFAEPGGPFMSRSEALNWVNKNEPEEATKLKHSQEYEGGGLEAGEYKKEWIKDPATGNYVEVKRAPAAAPSAIPPAPSAAEAHGAIQTARELATRQFKAKALADALNKSEIAADTSGSGGNIENATRQRLGRILTHEPWSEDETDQLNKMIHGTVATNLLRPLSRFDPRGNALMAALEMASGHGALKAAGGIAGSTGANIARRAGQKQLLATILAGGKAPVSPSYSAGPTRAALAAALASRQQLPRQENIPQ